MCLSSERQPAARTKVAPEFLLAATMLGNCLEGVKPEQAAAHLWAAAHEENATNNSSTLQPRTEASISGKQSAGRGNSGEFDGGDGGGVSGKLSDSHGVVENVFLWIDE